MVGETPRGVCDIVADFQACDHTDEMALHVLKGGLQG
jgi:hypothetical protein